jgi:hypothetical protein
MMIFQLATRMLPVHFFYETTLGAREHRIAMPCAAEHAPTDSVTSRLYMEKEEWERRD